MLQRPSIAGLLLLLCACASTPSTAETKPQPAPELEQEALRQIQDNKDRLDFPRILLQLDQTLESYAKALYLRGTTQRADQELSKLENMLRQLVNGEVDFKDKTVRHFSNKARLMALAADGSDTINQGIALSALGFAEGSDVMPVILQGAQLPDPQLVDRAILGLAILRDAATPPGVVIAVVENKKHPEDGRLQAAWALTVLQETSLHTEEIVAEWRRVLGEGESYHPLIVASALRGMGLTRKADDAALVARYLQHPTPKVRISAAVALGRMNAQDHWKDLLQLISNAETVPNVRLAARKALQTLAGGVDRGYDDALWRREFDRSSPSATQPAPAKK